MQAPIVVFDDADLISAVNGAAFASFVASGQTCVSGTRLIVHESIYDEFMKLFLAKVESIEKRMGDRELAVEIYLVRLLKSLQRAILYLPWARSSPLQVWNASRA